MTGVTASGAGLRYGYRTAWLRRDVLAGLATSAVVLPQAMAYATIAGLPVQAGLYCAVVPMTVYAFLGTSRSLSVSTTSTNSVLTATAVAAVAGGGADAATAALTLAVLTGVVLLAAGLLRMGFLADFVPRSVTAGLKAGMALLIATSQLGKVLGVPVDGDGFFDRIWSAATHLGQVEPVTVAVAAGVVVFLLVLRKFPRWPGPLLVVAAAIVVSAVFGLRQHGVAVIGPVDAGLPLPRLPSPGLLVDLLPAALGLGLMSFLESVTAARVFRRRADPRLDSDRELVVLGLANVAGGLFQAYPAAGGMSQTAVNDAAGAKSQGSSLVTVLCAAAVLLVLSPLLAPLPEAALGGMVLVIAAGLVDPRELSGIARTRRSEFVVALVALAGAVLLGLLTGVLVAVLLALFVLLYETNHPPVYLNSAADGAPDGLAIVRVEARLYFANAHRVTERIAELVRHARPAPRVVLLDLGAVPDIDLTAADAIAELHDELDRRGVGLWFAGINQRPLDVLHRSRSWRRPVREHRLYHDVASAVTQFRDD